MTARSLSSRLKSPPRQTEIRGCRARLLKAIRAAATAEGNAEWTNGYRARFESAAGYDAAEAGRLHEKEMAQWRMVGYHQTELRKALTAYERALNAQPKKGTR